MTTDRAIAEALKALTEFAEEWAGSLPDRAYGELVAAVHMFDTATRRAPGGAEDRAEIRRNADGSLDEIVGRGTFHLEQMDAGHWWMQLGPHAVHLTAHRAIKAIVGENEHRDDRARGEGGLDVY